MGRTLGKFDEKEPDFDEEHVACQDFLDSAPVTKLKAVGAV